MSLTAPRASSPSQISHLEDTHSSTEENQALISQAQNHRHPPGPDIQLQVRRRTTTSINGPQEPRNPEPEDHPSHPPPFNLRRAATSMLTPDKPVGTPPPFIESLKSVFFASWLNVMLVFIPISWALRFALPDSSNNKDTLVFVFSFLAIIPLAKLLAFATEELSMRVGQTLAGLLNATLGNTVELIVAIIALTKCELQIVQSSLVGSILSNLLLVLGMCFFAGGVKYSEQGFGVSATQLNSSLLTISVIAVLLPAAFHLSFQAGDDTVPEGEAILSVSHGVAIILLFIYGGYLFFQLFSHATLYQDEGEHVIKSTKYDPRGNIKFIDNARAFGHKFRDHGRDPAPVQGPGIEIRNTTRTNTTNNDPLANVSNVEAQTVTQSMGTKEVEQPQLTLLVTLGLLGSVTVLVAITAEWLVASINGMTDSGHISKEFVGIILLPIVGNAAEHATAVAVSVKDKLTLSLGVAVGSSIQISLFVIPFIVTLAWILGKPLTLLFDPYESITLFLAVLTVNYVVQDGKSNWLEGLILMCLYLILAVTFWFYPGSNPSEALNKCI